MPRLFRFANRSFVSVNRFSFIFIKIDGIALFLICTYTATALEAAAYLPNKRTLIHKKLWYAHVFVKVMSIWFLLLLLSAWCLLSSTFCMRFVLSPWSFFLLLCLFLLLFFHYMMSQRMNFDFHFMLMNSEWNVNRTDIIINNHVCIDFIKPSKIFTPNTFRCELFQYYNISEHKYVTGVRNSRQ